MEPIIREAVTVSQDFENVVFIGAIAVKLHSMMPRHTMDIDFVVGKEITNLEFVMKGYHVNQHEDKKYTPRGTKLDMYYKRELNDIPLDYIRKTAAQIQVDKKGTTLKVISLEGLFVAKFRSNREQDLRDLQNLLICCRSDIQLDEIRHLAKSDLEYAQLKRLIDDETFWKS